MISRYPWLKKEIHVELLRLSIPTVISTLAVPMLGVVDTAVLGRLPDVAQLAGAAAAGVILNVLFWMFGFLRMGTTALVAQYFGRDDRNAAVLVLFQSLLIGLVVGLVLIALKDVTSWIGFILVGAPDDVTVLGKAYFHIRMYEAPFFLMTLAITGYFRGQGDALVPMYLVIFVNIVNIVGDLLLVPGTFGLPSYGVVGAAWASVIAQSSGWVAAMVIGWNRVKAHWKWIWFKQVAQLAWGRFFQVQSHLFFRTLALVLTFAAVTSLVARLESAEILAAHAILMQLWSLVSYAVDGFAYATETTVGHWLGRGDSNRAKASAGAALFWGVGAGAVFAVVYFFSVDWLARFFTHDPNVWSIVTSLVWAVALSQPINALAYILDGILIGATDTRYLKNAMLVSSLVFVLIIAGGWAWAGLSLPLIWWGLLAFMTMRALTLWVRYRSDVWLG